MTITYTAEQVRELVKRDAERKNPGVILGALETQWTWDNEEEDWTFAGYTLEILDQSPFGISPERVKRGFDEAREAVRKATETP